MRRSCSRRAACRRSAPWPARSRGSLRRTETHKIAFNAGQVAIAVLTAELIYGLSTGPIRPTRRLADGGDGARALLAHQRGHRVARHLADPGRALPRRPARAVAHQCAVVARQRLRRPAGCDRVGRQPVGPGAGSHPAQSALRRVPRLDGADGRERADGGHRQRGRRDHARRQPRDASADARGGAPPSGPDGDVDPEARSGSRARSCASTTSCATRRRSCASRSRRCARSIRPRATTRALHAELHRISRVVDYMAALARADSPGFVRPDAARARAVPARRSRQCRPAAGRAPVARRCCRPGSGRHRPGPHAPGAAEPAGERGRARPWREAGWSCAPSTSTTTCGSQVAHEGGGVPAGHEDAIFEPFYRATPTSGGSALVRTVAGAHAALPASSTGPAASPSGCGCPRCAGRDATTGVVRGGSEVVMLQLQLTMAVRLSTLHPTGRPVSPAGRSLLPTRRARSPRATEPVKPRCCRPGARRAGGSRST